MDPVTFDNFYPVSGVWITNRNPSCSILINDSITGVDPLKIEYEATIEGEAGLVEDWLSMQESYSPDNSLYVVVTPWFQSGKLNYIRFRAWDVAGNGPFVSEAFNIWVDAEPPIFTLKSPLESEFNLNPMQQVKIDIRDVDSGIDFSSIEYRVSTQGKAKFGPWLPYKDAAGSPSQITMILQEEFARGDLNYVQVRAKDLVGNIRTSAIYNIKISSYPSIVLSSPLPDEVYYENERIVFDATKTYDPDGQNTPQFAWFRNTDEGTGLEQFGDTGYLSTDTFEPGEHTITLEVKSGQLPAMQYVFRLNIQQRPVDIETTMDTDKDKLPDWWEIQEGTDKLVRSAELDPDDDGYTNMQEYENGTKPLFKWSHPADPVPRQEDNTYKITDLWMLLVALAVIAFAILAVMIVARSKKAKAEKRIKAVRNMRRIMPSVSWEHITAASYMAAASSSGMMPMAPSGPALPGAVQTIPADQTLPPAPDHVVAQQQQTQ
jgi:hypothetical protein